MSVICPVRLPLGVHSSHDAWGQVVSELGALESFHVVLCPGTRTGLREWYQIHLSHKSHFNETFTKYKLVQKIHDEQYIKILK